MSTPDDRRQPTEDELRAAYEAQMKQIRVEQLILEQAVTLLDFGMRRTGLAPGTEDERDAGQVRLAVEGIRALMPLLEGLVAADQLAGFRDALSRLQMEFVRMGGAPATAADQGAGAAEPPAGQPDAPSPGKPGDPGPAQSSGRLWVPGQ